MISPKGIRLGLLFLLYTRYSVSERPNYLTEEDFEKARLQIQTERFAVTNGSNVHHPHPEMDMERSVSIKTSCISAFRYSR